MTNDDLKVDSQTQKTKWSVYGTSELELRNFDQVPNAYHLSAGQGKETYFPGMQASAIK